ATRKTAAWLGPGSICSIVLKAACGRLRGPQPAPLLRGMGWNSSCSEEQILRRFAPQDKRSAYFLSSTSTYSASITPSSFFWPPSLCAPACGPAPALGPSAGGACVDLYMASASLCEACVSFSRAE